MHTVTWTGCGLAAGFLHVVYLPYIFAGYKLQAEHTKICSTSNSKSIFFCAPAVLQSCLAITHILFSIFFFGYSARTSSWLHAYEGIDIVANVDSLVCNFGDLMIT